MKIALLGAESTGKTRLSQDLAAALRGDGRRVAVVPEVLREWCAREGRTPRPHEQPAIAQEQERRVDAALADADLVVADTTALMVAVYSTMLFDDRGLLPFALDRLRGYRLTLLTGLDLPWVADGLQRDGPHVREPVDALVREALAEGGIPYRVVYGQGPERLAAALDAVAAVLPGVRPPRAAAGGAWVWQCDKCSDPDCEHRLFTRLTASRT